MSDVELATKDLKAPTTTRELTLRAVLTGMLLGGTLSLCNVYLGLSIGWGMNLSITAALLSYGFWHTMRGAFGTAPWSKLENNINQTAASAAASISSAGLVAPVPALTMLTGYEWTWPVLVMWTFSVALVGVVVGIGLRRQMLEVDALPFPNGIAAGETLNEIYARGAEAMARVKMLGVGALIGGGTETLRQKIEAIKPLTWDLTVLKAKAGGALANAGIEKVTLTNLTFALSPRALFIGVGAIVGVRAGLSMLFGAIVGWAILAPIGLDYGWTEPGKGASWFKPVVNWLLWPGVLVMVTASLTSFAFSWRSVLNAFRGVGGPTEGSAADVVPRKLFVLALFAALVLSVIAQYLIFDIDIAIAVFAVMLTFALAIVAARVSGETNITPVGAMGKVTQLTFGIVAPGSAATNLMTANVTGGAASQAADLLHDLKTGLIVGASPRRQSYAQVFGILAGALCGSAAYLILIRDPINQLGTEEFAAPAMVQWKAVAELFKDGVGNLPPKAKEMMLAAGLIGVVLAVLEKMLPKKLATWVPSPTAAGIAMVIPASYAVSMCLGGVLAWGAHKRFPVWSKRFIMVLGAGIIAGDSIVGFGFSLYKVLQGLG